MNELNLYFEIEAITLNNAYPTSCQGRRFLSSRGKQFKHYISVKTKSEAKEFKADAKAYKLNLLLGFSNYFTKKNTVNKKRPDISNCIKLIEDSIFESLGVNDVNVVNITVEVVQENTTGFIMAKVSKLN